MNGREYIEACKKQLNLDSYYKLAIALDIAESDIHFYAKEKRLPSVYACFKIAECLGLDPAIIMADIASEEEKNPKKREFFKRFMSSCTKAAAGILPITAMFNFMHVDAIGLTDNALRIMRRYAR
jgi:DNA-binding XRE family transcriptional regulator